MRPKTLASYRNMVSPGATVDFGRPISRGMDACYILAAAPSGGKLIDVLGKNDCALAGTRSWIPLSGAGKAPTGRYPVFNGTDTTSLGRAIPERLQKSFTCIINFTWDGVTTLPTGGIGLVCNGRAGASGWAIKPRTTISLRFTKNGVIDLNVPISTLQANRVHQLAVVVEEDSSVTGYTDGLRTGSASNTSAIRVNTSGEMRIGSNNSLSGNAADFWGGAILSVAHWNRELTPNEIQMLSVYPMAFLAQPITHARKVPTAAPASQVGQMTPQVFFWGGISV